MSVKGDAYSGVYAAVLSGNSALFGQKVLIHFLMAALTVVPRAIRL